MCPQDFEVALVAGYLVSLAGVTNFGQRTVGCCWLKFDHQFQTCQHVATHRNTVAKRTQHVAPVSRPTMLRYVELSYVAIVWPGL